MALPTSSSAQRMPSRLVMHTLHAMLLGTACSLLVLTEERRRRIRTAQTLVENARKLNQFKRQHHSKRTVATVSGEGSRAVGGEDLRTREEEMGGLQSGGGGGDSAIPTQQAGGEAFSRTKPKSKKPHKQINNLEPWILGRLDANPMANSIWQQAGTYQSMQTKPSPIMMPFVPPKLGQTTPTTFTTNKTTDSGVGFWAEVTAEQVVEPPAEQTLWEDVEFFLQMGHPDLAADKFAKMVDTLGLTAERIDQWVGMLQKARQHELSVDEWKRYYIQLRPNRTQFRQGCQMLTKVYDLPADWRTDWNPYRDGACPKAVLEAMVKIGDETGVEMPGVRIGRILDAFHDRYQDFEQLKKLFYQNMLAITTNSDHPASPLRCMIGHAAKAGDVATVRNLSVEFGISVGLVEKAMLKTKFMLAQAKSGDWEGVREGFFWARRMGGPGMLYPQRQDLNEILHAYAAAHSDTEVEAFIRTYVLRLGIVFGPQMVRLVADMYARSGDIEGFGIWIRVCIKQGFGKTTELLESVLDACAKHWKYGRNSMVYLLKQLMERSQAVGKIEGAETNKTNTKPQLYAVLIDPAYGEMAKKYVDRYLALPRTRQALASELQKRDKAGSVGEQLWNEMWSQLQRGQWSSVVKAYKKALANGFLPTDGILCLAVVAATEQHSNDPSSQEALDLIHQARELGVIVQGSVAKLLMERLRAIDEIGRRGDDGFDDERDVVRATRVETLIRSMIDAGLPIPQTVLNRATRMCLRSREYKTALQLCQLSAAVYARSVSDNNNNQITNSEANDKNQNTNSRTTDNKTTDNNNIDIQITPHTKPLNKVDILSSQFNFSNLVFIFSATRHYAQLNWILIRLENGSYPWASDNVVFRALQRSERRLRQSAATARSERSRTMHDDAWKNVVRALDYVKALRMFAFAAGKQARSARTEINRAILNALATDQDGFRGGVHLEKQWVSS